MHTDRHGSKFVQYGKDIYDGLLTRIFHVPLPGISLFAVTKKYNFSVVIS